MDLEIGNSSKAVIDLSDQKNLLVRQVHEVAEFFGFETRNKYEVLDQNQNLVAFAAEQQKGFWGWFMRQFLGHWRTFEIHFFDSSRKQFMTAYHPFRFYFQRLEISDANNSGLGVIQQRFSIFSKRFDVQNHRGQVILEVASPLWRIWTFDFFHNNRVVASIKKKWSGLFSEAFTDKDNFMIEFSDPSLSNEKKQLILAAAVFVDLKYFERKARS
ncbi:MAG: phospholipid scramblase-related protein [Pseudomonadota bacterium]|nr:phospholipid scramblase-related protein [Pseudomonadota bacterium]